MVVTDAVVIEEIFWDCVEKEAEDTVRELGFLLAVGWVDKLRIKLMDNMELKIEQLTVDGMFRRGMEMSLETEEGAFLDMAIK